MGLLVMGVLIQSMTVSSMLFVPCQLSWRNPWRLASQPFISAQQKGQNSLFSREMERTHFENSENENAAYGQLLVEAKQILLQHQRLLASYEKNDLMKNDCCLKMSSEESGTLTETQGYTPGPLKGKMRVQQSLKILFYPLSQGALSEQLITVVNKNLELNQYLRTLKIEHQWAMK